MGLRLLAYLVVLLIGALISYKGKISKRLYLRLDLFQTISILFLLFIMGIKIGNDRTVISSFFTIGFKAIIMSLFTISFSVLGVFLVKKFIFKKEDTIES